MTFVVMQEANHKITGRRHFEASREREGDVLESSKKCSGGVFEPDLKFAFPADSSSHDEILGESN